MILVKNETAPFLTLMAAGTPPAWTLPASVPVAEARCDSPCRTHGLQLLQATSVLSHWQ